LALTAAPWSTIAQDENGVIGEDNAMENRVGTEGDDAEGELADTHSERIASSEADGGSPQQVSVAVKIVEFQTDRLSDRGFSAYFARRAEVRPYGRVSTGQGNITAADLTFPASTAPTITVFLDRIALGAGNVEIILQALEEENRAYILSRPKALVTLGNTTTIATSQQIPFQATKVAGTTVTQVTSFRDTGVNLRLTLNNIIDDDGDWSTTEDQYIQLHIDASVSEEGQQFVIALDDQVASGGAFSQPQNIIQAPEFVKRQIVTEAWVRHGQVLMLGGLYRRTTQKSVRTAPWLNDAENNAIGLMERAVPGSFLPSPLSDLLGSRSSSEAFRELVFIIKADVWRPSQSTYDFAQDEIVDVEESVEQ
jgi:Flp pilus assembly secretin CpaC